MRVAIFTMFILLLLSGCGDSSADDLTKADPDGKSLSTSAEKESDQIPLDTATESLSSYFESGSYKVSHSGNTVTAVAVIPGLADKITVALSAKTIPDGWAYTVTTATTAAQTLMNATKDAGIDDVATVLYIRNNLKDGEIYLTFINGKNTFSVFNEPSEAENPSTITLAEFNKIAVGMTYDEVIKIVGGPGEIAADADIGAIEYQTSLITWEGEGSLGANANVTIQGGKVISKAQFGLE